MSPEERSEQPILERPIAFVVMACLIFAVVFVNGVIQNDGTPSDIILTLIGSVGLGTLTAYVYLWKSQFPAKVESDPQLYWKIAIPLTMALWLFVPVVVALRTGSGDAPDSSSAIELLFSLFF